MAEVVPPIPELPDRIWVTCDEWEALRAENLRLREALTELVEAIGGFTNIEVPYTSSQRLHDALAAARAVLAGETPSWLILYTPDPVVS